MERMILKRRARFEQAEKNFEREKQRISKVEKETMQLVTDMIRL